MLRVWAVVLLVGMLALAASSFAWLRSTAPLRVELRDDLHAVLQEFERAHRPVHTIDLLGPQNGRSELFDPKLVLPTWHLHPRNQAATVFAALRQCPPPPLAIAIDDPSLAKAYDWHTRTCSPGAAIPERFLDEPPFMHPSGASYAALALARPNVLGSFAKAHAHDFHVLELAAIEETLDAKEQVLGSLGARVWDAIAHGDQLILTPSFLVFADHPDHAPPAPLRLRLYDRKDWETTARRNLQGLVPRREGETCARPASSALCWQALSPIDRQRQTLIVWSSFAAGTCLLAAVALLITYVGERRRIHADRVHILRTLTHELRTPAMSLGIDIEPLRAAYDELPPSCQEPMLRLSDGIARLGRVLHLSAKYMALFESNASKKHLVVVRPIASVDEWLRELASDAHEDVIVTGESKDGPLATDPDWLAVAIRNLIENAARHGKAPIRLGWRFDGTFFVVRVTDGGSSKDLSLRKAIAPHHRGLASQGLGLGLAIVDRVARLLSGTLTHESSPTSFEIRVVREVSS